MTDPKPKAIDGQKKFTATLIGFLMSFLNSLTTTGIMTEEAASPLIQILAIGGPIVGAVLYDLIQGSHDKVKVQKDIVEIEKRFLLPPKPETPALPSPTPKLIDFKAFIAEVLDRVDTDDAGRPRQTSLLYALWDEGKQWKVDSLDDVIEYGQLCRDAANGRFEEVVGVVLDDPELMAKLNAQSKCHYSTVDAYCSYEKGRTALRDARRMFRKANDVITLSEVDTIDFWRTYFDTSLYGIFEGSSYLLSRLQQKGA